MTTQAHWQPISSSRHANAGWVPYSDYHHAANQTTTPLLAAELSKASAIYPLAFLPQGETNYQLVAVHSLQPNINLFVNSQGKWLAPYVPAWYRSHPMRLLENKETGEQLLCVDEASPLFQAKIKKQKSDSSASNESFIEKNQHIEMFFDEEGKPSAILQGVIDFQKQCYTNRLVTEKLVQQLVDADLIEPWELNLQIEEGEAQPVSGLYRINEAALQELAGDTLEALAKNGALVIAYAQLLSADRIKDLEHRYRYKAQDQAQQASGHINLDELFGDDDGEDLKFGF